MRVFMRELETGKFVQVHENDWKEEDVYIDDVCHHSRCWSDCYTEGDLVEIVRRRKGPYFETVDEIGPCIKGQEVAD